MTKTHTVSITVPAAKYADHDDCLAAAAADYLADHPDLAGWDLSPSWVDEQRDEIALSVPAWSTASAIRIAPSIGTRSTCVDTEGALDYDVTVTIGDLEIEGEVTLAPSQYDGQLDSWGASPDHWVSDGLLRVLRDLPDARFREVLGTIRSACVSGEAVEVEV